MAGGKTSQEIDEAETEKKKNKHNLKEKIFDMSY